MKRERKKTNRLGGGGRWRKERCRKGVIRTKTYEKPVRYKNGRIDREIEYRHVDREIDR